MPKIFPIGRYAIPLLADDTVAKMPRSWRCVLVLPALLGAACATTGQSGRGHGPDPRLERARLASREMRRMLGEYYGGPEVLRETWLLQPGEPAYEAGLDALAEKIARAFVWREPFVVGTIGSSVTAAHDNCHEDSYQRQLERLMAPVWAAAGIPFEVRNAGQGGDCGDSHQNQIWCVRDLVGDDVDVVHYSWTYFEGREGYEPFHEMFYRWSLGLPRAPAPELLYTSDCSTFSDLDRELLADYAPFGADVLCMERGISARGYPGKKWGVVGDGLHDTTREGEQPGVSAERRQSLGVVFRNWHPGPLLFQTTADALGDRYAAALLRALDWIEATADPAARWPRDGAVPRAELPGPRACDPEWCAASRIPACVTYGDPVLGVTDVVRSVKPSASSATASSAAAAGAPGDVDAGWVYWRRAGRPMVPEAERDLPGCMHPTACGGWQVPASREAGWLSFRLPDLAVGFLAVCCGSGKTCGREMLDAGVELRIDGEPPVEAPEVLWGKCIKVQTRFPEGAGRRSGGDGPRSVDLDLRFPVSQKPSPPISHVIGL